MMKLKMHIYPKRERERESKSVYSILSIESSIIENFHSPPPSLSQWSMSVFVDVLGEKKQVTIYLYTTYVYVYVCVLIYFFFLSLLMLG